MNVCTNCIYNTCCGTVRETCEGRHTIAQAKRELKAAKESGDKKAINIYTALLERQRYHERIYNQSNKHLDR